MLMLCSDTYFLEVSAHVSLKVATRGSKVVSKSLAFFIAWKVSVFGVVLVRISAFGLNTERYRVFVFSQNISIQNMRIQSECGKMQTRITPDRGTFYALFKVTFLKQKQRSMTKKTEVSLISLALLYLAQPHVFWK